MYASENDRKNLISIVYLITNNINSKVYVGSTIGSFNHRYTKRWWRRMHNEHLKKSIKKYGKNNFSVYIIDYNLDEKKLLELENSLIRLFNSDNSEFGYNKKTTGENIRFSVETRKKISEGLLDSQEDFIKKAKQVHGIKFDYSLVKYLRADKKVQIICNKCNYIFWQKASHHTGGHGCKKCAVEEIKRRCTRPFSEFLKLAIKRFGDRFRYFKNSFINNKTKMKILCKKCKNRFLQSPEVHLISKYACPFCAQCEASKTFQKKVARLDPDTNTILKTYDSLKSARKKNKCYAIFDACHDQNLIVRGFKWRYLD